MITMTPRQTRFLIAVQRPGLWIATAVALLAVVAVAIWTAYEQGRRMAGYDAGEVDQHIAGLETHIESLEAELDESRRQAAMLERNSSIDSDTSEQLKKSLNEAQTEAVELKKELAFYKSIVAPELGKRSVTIQTVQLKPDSSGSYDYKIMVAQTGSNERFARGVAEVSVEGSVQGQSKVLALTDLSAEARKSMKFGFRYFQNFTGKLKLPDDFEAEAMRVKLVPKTKALDPVDERFPWADITAGG